MTTLFRNSSPGTLTRQQAVDLEKKRMAQRRRAAEELAAQGRRGDTEIALPDALQTAEVLNAIRQAAADANIPLERLRVGSGRNSVNPNTGVAEFADAPYRYEGPEVEEITVRAATPDSNGDAAGAVGAAARGAYAGINAGNVRDAYIQAVGELDPYNDFARARMKEAWRLDMPPETRVQVADKPLYGREGSVGHANVVNPSASRTARLMRAGGRGLGGFGAGLAAYDVATADNKPRAIAANIGAAAGGFLGGAGGAALGLMGGGPVAPVAVPALAVAGSAAGGEYGYRGGEKVYDFVADRFHRWRR